MDLRERLAALEAMSRAMAERRKPRLRTVLRRWAKDVNAMARDIKHAGPGALATEPALARQLARAAARLARALQAAGYSAAARPPRLIDQQPPRAIVRRAKG